MHLRTIDLNLLVMFEALVAERSVSGAARRLGLSQSAVSHALRRLRTTFRDELFVRTPDGMEPTGRALEAAEGVRMALDQIERTIGEPTVFDQATTVRSFNLRISEYVSSYLLQRLCPLLRQQAPGIQLNAAHFTGGPRDNEIVGDEIHIRLGESQPPPSPKLSRRRVLEEQFVVLINNANPAKARRMTLPLYASLPHVKVAGTVGTNIIDEALHARGLKRNVVFNVPSWRDARRIVGSTDLIAAIPGRWAADPDSPQPCSELPFPLNTVRFAIDLMWHSRYERDPGHAWLRSAIAAQFA